MSFAFPPRVSLFCLLRLISVYLSILTSIAIANEQTWSATPFNTQSIPLHVKNPCNSMWAPQAFGPAQVSSAWPRLWDAGIEIKTWFAVVRVDGISYEIIGGDVHWTSANQTAVIVTPTRSSYLLNAGPIIVNMTFLSPVEPDDPVKMSSPFSYIYFTFTSNDTSVPHDVQLYSDITGEWISGDSTKEMTWSGNDDGSSVILQTSLVSPEPFQINGETCQDGTVYYAVQSGQNVQWQIGPPAVRDIFQNGSSLSNSASPPPSLISSLNILSIVVDVGSVQTTTSPIVYTIGIVRDPVIQYINGETLVPYYRVKYDKVNDLIDAVLQNFSASVTAAQELDLQLAAAGEAISGNYSDLLSISTRQAFGAFDYTVSLSDNNEVNASDVKAFSRNFGSLGSGGVNAPDVIYAAMPAYIYLWPDLLKMLLLPLFEYQESPPYTNTYAAQDIGAAYPNATGDSLAHNMQVEQSANMIIIALAHAQASGDGSLLNRYYDQLNKWANFLVNNSLTPNSQETTSITDGISAANQTNLALKGILGLGAMAIISNYTDHKNDKQYYQSLAAQYAQEWTSLAVSSRFISLTYGSSGSGVLYNLYVDKLLRTNLINDSVFALQSSYYGSEAEKVPFGIPLNDESSTLISRTDWTMFAAASAADNTTRDQLISGIHSYASVGLNDGGNFPFTVVYDPNTSDEIVNSGGKSNVGGINSFAQGAMFAPLALSIPIQEVKVSGNSGSDSDQSESDHHSNSEHRNNVAIIGGIVGGIVAGLFAISLFIYLYRRRAKSIKDSKTLIAPYKGRDSIISGYTVETRRDSGIQNYNIEYNDSPTSGGYLGGRFLKNVYRSEKTGRRLDFATQPTILEPLAESIPESRRRDSEPIEREVAELRRQIERIRMERHSESAFGSSNSTEATLPPSYDSV